MIKTRRAAALLISLCAVLLLSGCGSIFDAGGASVLVASDELSHYGEIIDAALPDMTVGTTAPGNLPAALETEAAAVEAFGTQAYGYLESGAAKYFYPHYLATVIIAVDRKQTDVLISSWSDLPGGEYPVVFPGYQHSRYAVIAMSVGLDDGTYDMTNALKLINKLYTSGRLIPVPLGSWGIVPANAFDSAPVAIMFDYEAASLIKSGRNIEIIVPREGTLTFPAGLLSDTELKPDTDMLNTLLLDGGFRLPDGNCDAALYPSPHEYSFAQIPQDAERFSLAYQDVSARLRREGFDSYKWSTANGDEHTVSFLAFFIVITLWGGTIYMRTLHKGIRKAMLFAIALLILRVFLRYVKTMFGEELFAARFCWYCYYIPLLLIPVSFLWIAWMVDKPEDEAQPPRWWWGALTIAAALIVLTLTNDIHQIVFTFNPGFVSWMRSHGFGFGYYLFLAFFIICTFSSLALFIRKTGRTGFSEFLPIGIVVLLGGAFMAADYAGVPFVAEMQTPFVSAVLLLLFFEAALHTGLIPSNTNYVGLFQKSPLALHILSDKLTVWRKTDTAGLIDDTVISKITGGQPIQTSADAVWYPGKIRGGWAVLREDLSTLNVLRSSLEAKRRELTKRGKFLRQEQRLKDELITLQIQNRLYDAVENTVNEKAQQIASLISMILQSTDDDHARSILARAAVLTGYVKCRSNLLLTGKTTADMSLYELSQLTRDSAESARAAGIDCAVYVFGDDKIPFSVGILAYDIYEHYLECSLRYAPCDLTVRCFAENGTFRMTVLLSAETDESPKAAYFAPDEKLFNAIRSQNGSLHSLDEDETLVFNVFLPFDEGGGADG